MDIELRVVLLTVGLIVIVGIVLDGIRRKRKIQKQVQEFDETVISNPNREDPGFLQEDDPLLTQDWETPASKSDTDILSEVTKKPRVKPAKIPTDQKVEEVIALCLLPQKGGTFSGRAINAAFQANQLKFGDKRIYHKFRGDKLDSDVLYSVASLTEPGTFEPNKLATSQFKGLMIFMVVSNIHDPYPTFEKMLGTARLMSHALGAKLLDGQRCTLTSQTIEHFKEQIREYQRRQLAWEKTIDS